VARLLLDLPECRFLPPLALLELALRQRPVHVLRAVDHRDPGLAVLIRGEQHPAGRADLGFPVPDLEVLAGHRRSVLPAALALLGGELLRRLITPNTIAGGARSGSISLRNPPTPAPARSSGGRGGRSSPDFARDSTTRRCWTRSRAPTRSRSTLPS